jgi:uncharacterized repeat protein (TIGR01451 family)
MTVKLSSPGLFALALLGLASPLLAADLSISKVGPTGLKPGDQVVYTITVTNLDAGDVRDAEVNDQPPAGFTFVSNTGDCTTPFPCTLPLLGTGLSANITSTFAVPANYSGTGVVLNTATVTSTADNNPANNTATWASARVDGFYTLPPCRVADTRFLGGPFLVAGTVRTFNLRDVCGLPANAIAVSYNITVTGGDAPGNLRLFPGGSAAPLASSLNYAAGQTRANNGIVPISATGQLAVQCDQALNTGTHFILDVNGYFASTDAVATAAGTNIRVRPAPEVEITFDDVVTPGTTTARVIEFADTRTGDVDQDLKDFFPLGSPLRDLVPSVTVPSYLKGMGDGGPGGTPTFVLAIIDSTAVFRRTAEFHGLEDFLLGWHPPCVITGDRTQEPRTFYAPETAKGEPALVEGNTFVDVSSGCGSNKAAGWSFSLYLTGRDTRTPLDIARFKLQNLEQALQSYSRFINGTVFNNLLTEVQAALASLDGAPANSLQNLTNFVGIIDANPSAFPTSGNISGELVGRALSASYVIRKLGGPRPFDVMIGDNDGFGFGAASVPDNGNFLFQLSPYAFQDRRGATEQSATDGSQQTDAYSSLIFPLSQSFEVKFPVEGLLQSATLELDMGGFEAGATYPPIAPSPFPETGIAFNGVNKPGLLFFNDGALTTRVRQFPLSAADIARANAEGVFRVTFTIGPTNADGYVDAIAFDYLRLTGTAQP